MDEELHELEYICQITALFKCFHHWPELRVCARTVLFFDREQVRLYSCSLNVFLEP